jgi:hypothetical protein
MRLFASIRAAVGGAEVLYPGSFVDVAPSIVFPSVTYVDMDKRTPGFFADRDGIVEIVTSSGGSANVDFRFIHADYQEPLDLPAQSFDLLVSLYAGFVSEFCTGYLKIGGRLLVAPSHGDAAMASIDSRYELSGVVGSRNGEYRVRTENLDQYLISKSSVDITPAMLHERGRGVAYTKSPFAYLFTRVR